MPSRSAPHRRVASSLLLAGLAALGLLLCAAREPEPSAGPALTDGLTLERDLQKGETHSYPVELQTGQFLRVVVQEIGVDVAVRLFDPAGAEVTGADGPVAGSSAEDLAALAASAGRYRLDVRAESRRFPKGRYRLRVEGPRAAAGDDALRAEAVKAFWTATSDPEQDREALKRDIASLARALPLWEQLREPERAAETIFLLGHFRSLLPEESERAVQDFLRAASSWGSQAAPEAKDWQARSLNFAGKILVQLGRSEEAREDYEEALAVVKGLGYPGTESSSLNNLALMEIDRGELQKGIAGLSEALQKARQAGDPTPETMTLINLGDAYDQLAEPHAALRYYGQALDLARASGQRLREALVLNNLGLAYFSLGDLETALKHYHQALAVIQTLSGHPNEERTLINLGQALLRMGRFEEAKASFLQALAATKDPEARMSAFLSQSYLLVALKQPAQAVAPARQALELAQGFPDREANALCALGIAHREAGDLPAAREELSRALALVHTLQDRSREAEIGVSLAKAERDAGDRAAARGQARASVDLLESLRTKVFDQRLRTSFLATKQNFYEVYIDTLMPRGKPAPAAADVAAALQVSERARARSLLDILTESGADVRAGGDPALAQREQRLHDRLNSLDSYRFKLLSAEKPDRRKLGETERQLEEALDGYRKAQADLRASSPGYAALTQPQPLSVDEIRAQVLDGRALLLEYALGEKRSFLWVVTPGEVASFELPGRDRIEPLARRYYELVTARNLQPPAESLAARKRRIEKADAEAERAGSELSHRLLAPAARLLGDRPLLVVADGALQYVPFAALPSPGASAPLASRHEVVSLPSASALAALRHQVRNRPRAAKALAILADPVFQATDERLTHSSHRPQPPTLSARRDGGWSPERQDGEQELASFGRLPSSDKEARTISALVPRGSLLLATGFAATRAKALSPELAGYRNLHFATHGVLDSRRPELSKLVLSLYDEHGRTQNGFLPLNDIYNLHLNADLVVLSACRTALGQEIRGEGLVGLTRGFMYAGAARVLASLWSVEDRATAELMGELYRGMLRQGLSPAAALRRAQLAMLKSPSHRAPFYWAGFSLQGEWR
jgi:CHAT domain-containing protein/tetratricopeptide (TPR) repeat protein